MLSVSEDGIDHLSSASATTKQRKLQNIQFIVKRILRERKSYYLRLTVHHENIHASVLEGKILVKRGRNRPRLTFIKQAYVSMETDKANICIDGNL